LETLLCLDSVFYLVSLDTRWRDSQLLRFHRLNLLNFFLNLIKSPGCTLHLLRLEEWLIMLVTQKTKGSRALDYLFSDIFGPICCHGVSQWPRGYFRAINLERPTAAANGVDECCTPTLLPSFALQLPTCHRSKLAVTHTHTLTSNWPMNRFWP
jgi:hypothetical protein